MGKTIKIVMLVLCIHLTSCSKTDDTHICNGDCNQFKGRVYTEDNVGIPNVEITVSFSSSYNPWGTSYTRIIAKSTTDSEGNYVIEGYIKDKEFSSGHFFLTIDENKIENSISTNFLKPSDIYQGDYEDNNIHFIPYLTNRTQIITTDYKIPYKTNLTVNLNDFIPTTSNDLFGVGNAIRYGFENEYRFLTKQANNQGYGFSNGTNATFLVPAVYGENHLKVYKFKNGLQEYIDDIIMVTNPNTSPPLNYSF
ncbi:carboxypeptidase-like regulatory domain-containing protein [Flavobacterium phycosphaerae]|uniref:carboxypeptidase-like regulatory domain-containing protein n=1 Tax=Flavobacterium phycosphaerae TaxID=2697515 RepID=UPI001389C9A9|nr:carboxypeptidase-like regulatory domain-containing protein [Flavobacterium phycosphaerae]